MQGEQTATEIALEKQLEEDGLEVVPQFHDGHKRVDLRVRDAKVDIEVDGLHHLTNPFQINKDLNRSHYSHREGYETLHVQNRDVRSHLKTIARAITRALKFRTKRIKSGARRPA